MGRKVVGKDERLGYISKDCNGNPIKVIEYLEYKRVKVKWETGETSWTSWYHVVDGSIKRPEVRLGTTHKDVCGEEFKVVEYNSSSDVTVCWDDGATKNTSWGSIIKGIEKPVDFNSRIGLRFENRSGDKYTIVGWVDSSNVVVEWELTGNRSTHQWSHVSRSNIRNPKRSIYGVGYASSRFHNDTNVYNAWRRMLCRAYDEGFHKRQPSYKDVEVSEELHDYAHFYKVYTSLGDFLQGRGEFRCHIVAQPALELCQDRIARVPADADDEREAELRLVGVIQSMEACEFFLRKHVEADARLLAS